MAARKKHGTRVPNPPPPPVEVEKTAHPGGGPFPVGVAPRRTPRAVWLAVLQRAETAVTMRHTEGQFAAMCMLLNDESTPAGAQWQKRHPYRLNKHIAVKAYREIIHRWQQEIRARDPEIEKLAQIKRLQSGIAKLHAQDKPAQAARLEAILADIIGSREPLQVNVNQTVSHAITAVIANLTPEAMAKLVERQRKQRELAAQAMKQPPQLVQVIPAKVG